MTVSQLTEDNAIFRGDALVAVVHGDLLERLQDEGADPDTDIGGRNVHQSEAGEHFEAVDVELE